MKQFVVQTLVNHDTPEECLRMSTGDWGIVCDDSLAYLSEVFSTHKSLLNTDELKRCRCSAKEIGSIAGDLDTYRHEMLAIWRQREMMKMDAA